MIGMTPSAPIPAGVLRDHLGTLIDDPFGIFARRWPDQSQWAGRPIMLRQGDHLEPLVQSGVHDGHIVVETWSSYEQRLIAGDRQ